MTETIQHLTNSVIMVRPVDFSYNPQTGVDNEFQHTPKQMQAQQVQKQALAEFEQCANTLNQANIETMILGKTHTNKPLPDAVFPNNWFSTRADGKLIIYPMKTPNRRDEVQIEPLCEQLKNHHYSIDTFIDYREIFDPEEVLEGTGSLIFHHPSQQLFAAISERCHLSAVKKFAEAFNYQLTHFNTSSSNGSPIYHSNVLMSCGENFSVLTSEIIAPPDKKGLLESLENCVDDIVIINESQMSESFCGNILQLKDKNNEPIITLSSSAYHGFKPRQIKQLEKHGSLIICNIETIEYIGGGSLRCMLAENFFPKIQK